MGLLTAALNLVILTVLFTFIQSQEYIRTKRRMYAMCPPKFQRIGAECYAISDQPANWLEAHFQCKDKNSKLAEPNNKSDRKLRAFFQRMDHDTDDIWIGATYDWNVNIWQWSISGKNLTYDAFSRMDPKSSQSLEYHCAVLNPSLKYRWSARPCVDKHRYICQHKMPRVSKKNRFKVYNRWNQTYPNQLANEVEMEVIDTKTKDGKRTTRRLKPIDSSENYPMPPKRSTVSTHAPPREINNDIHVKFIPNYLTNEINGDVSYRTPSPAKDDALTMEFIPAVIDMDNNNMQANEAYIQTTTKRPRNPTNAPSRDNETVTQMKPRTNPTGKRVKTKFDELIEEKRRLDRNQKRRRRKLERIRLQKEKKLEEERKKREEERKKQEDERKRQEEQEKLNEEERKKGEQVVIEQLKLKHAEEKKQQEAAALERQKLEEQLKISKEEQERQEAEAKILKEKREEEEEHIRKQRLHEENRLKLEYEERLKEQQTERERRLEEEKRVADENRRRIEQEEAARQEELKRLQEEDEKRLELQRMEIERKRQEKELARLEEENQKRIAAQKAREEEIRRREEALAAQLEEEKRLLEELRIQQEKDRLMHEQELQSDIDEKKKQEEAERQEKERKEALQKQKTERFKEKLAREAKKLEEQKKLEEEAKLEEQKKIKREKLKKYAERISRLPPDMQAKFFQLRKERQRKKQNNEASIPERK